MVTILPSTSLTSTTAQQNFQVPNFTCPIWQVNFSGGTGSTVYIATTFATPGFSNWPLASPTASASVVGVSTKLNGWEDGGIGVLLVGAAAWGLKQYLSKKKAN